MDHGMTMCYFRLMPFVGYKCFSVFLVTNAKNDPFCSQPGKTPISPDTCSYTRTPVVVPILYSCTSKKPAKFPMEDFSDLPKIELHLHLDCSLSYDVVSRFDPEIGQEEYEQTFIAPDKCRNLVDYLTRAVRGVQLLQTPDQLRMATLDLLEQLHDDRVLYTEIRLGPHLHTAEGLSPEKVVEAVTKALEDGEKKTGVNARVILSTLRHFGTAQSLETAELAKKFRGRHVVGFDIAGDEAGFPVDCHIPAFRFASENKIPCTAHAGEAMGPASIRETLHHFRPVRIGHGVRAIEDPGLPDELKKRKIHLEVCPTSNIQTNVFESMSHHSVDRLFRHGVSLSINTDSRTVSNVSLSDEYRTLNRYFGWDINEFRQCNLEAIRFAFADDTLKRQLRQRIEDAYGW